jgi:hypothetical protein
MNLERELDALKVEIKKEKDNAIEPMGYIKHGSDLLELAEESTTESQ